MPKKRPVRKRRPKGRRQQEGSMVDLLMGKNKNKKASYKLPTHYL